MSNYNWKSGVSGDWGTTSDWVQGTVANSTTANVTISSSSAIEVTIGATERFLADSVTLDSVGVTLGVAGMLNLGGSKDQLLINAGTVSVGSTGTIANGTIIPGGGDVILGSGATLDDVTYRGNLDITANYSTLSIMGALKVESASGGSPGTINLTGIADKLNFAGNTTLDNVGINLGAAGQDGFEAINVAAGDSLTLGSHATVTSAGTYGTAGFYGLGDVVNDGILNAGGVGVIINFAKFTNAGTINVSAGSYLIFETATASNLGIVNAAGTIGLYGNQTLSNLNNVSLSGGGLLDILGSLDLGGGTLAVGGTDNIGIGNGTVSNGTLVASLGTLTLGDNATLDDVTYKGILNLTNGYLYVVGGLNVENASGGTPGTINVSGDRQTLNFEGSQTLDDVDINLSAAGQGSDGNRIIFDYQGGAVTLGTDVSVNSNGVYANSFGGNGLDNDGTINIAGKGVDFQVTTFDNAGTINVAAGSSLSLEMRNIVNNGEINDAGRINLHAQQSLAKLGAVSLTGSGLLDIIGGLNLGGGTLAVGGTDNIEISGTVGHGTINPSLGTLDLASGATLDDVTYRGNLDIAEEFLTITGGIKVENASGDSPGTISFTGESSYLYFDGDETLDNVAVTLGAGNLLVAQTGILTLGPHATVNANGGASDFLAGTDILNHGIINVGGAELIIDPETFANAGTIDISGGSTLALAANTVTNSGLIEVSGTGTARVILSAGSSFTNLSATTLTGGAFKANPHDTLALNLNGTIFTTDDGQLTLSGAGSRIEEYQSASGTYLSLESTLETIGSGGTLQVLVARGYNTQNTLDIDGGKFALGGGTFKAASLDLTAPSSRFTGHGTIKGPIANAGSIITDIGTLVIDGPLSGAGALVIGLSSTLELTTGTSENITFAGPGSLHSALILEAPTLYTGTLSGIAAGDSIDLAGEMASSASLSGTSLLVTLTNHSVQHYTLASALPMEGVSVSSDGGTGSELTFYQLPAAPAAAEMRFITPPAPAAASAVPASSSLPALRELWSGATNYRPNFSAHSGQASFTNPHNLQTELGNMPTPANAGIILPGQLNWEFSGSPYHNLTLLPPKG
jgi:hypothetical protein